MTDVGILVAFFAGIVSFASPCCLPLVPVYVSYMVGTTPNGQAVARRAAFVQALAFVAGFTFVFVALWASVGIIGYFFRDYVWLMRQAGGAILIFMGLHVAGLISISALYRDIRFRTRPAPTPAEGTDSAEGVRPSLGRSTLLGMVFAAGWTPCIGPILGGIIGLASVSGSAAWGTVLLLAYALGLGIPFILVAVGATAVSVRLRWFRRHETAVSLVSGGMLVLVGFLMITNLFVRLPSLLPTGL